ncbi:ABC transporter [Exidia glandulosa HHB12029]|uniref:ABC transporter n=1 Tax=Exidia glandulosa HHB12029 TaxID=1314781 RepID=A0A165IRK7_EXIGL|nr:ABC transporter [Exidia glandulosa HHB12029]
MAVTDSPSKTPSVQDADLEKAADVDKEKAAMDAVQYQDLKYDPVSWWVRVPFTQTNPPPPSGSLDDAKMIPEATASWFSLVTFEWMTPILGLGYARPLVETDLYKLQDSRSSKVIADKIMASYDAQMVKADAYNARLASGEISPGLKGLWWSLRGVRKEREAAWREKDGKKRPSLFIAMNHSVAWFFWSGGILKVIADISQVTSPLLVKAIINFASQSYFAHQSGGTPPGIGKGIGLSFGLLFLQLFSSLCTHHFFYRGAGTGVLLRGGLITAIYERSLKLSARARLTLTTGRLVNHISTDVSRIDFACGFAHMSWSSVIQMIVCLIILITNMGPSAIAGFALFIILTPLQTYAMKALFKIRFKSMAWTDKRVKLLQELLGGIRILKLFAWEVPFLKRIAEFRGKETGYIRELLILRSINNAVAFSMPVFAAVVAFLTYSLTGHDLDPAIIFSSLSLFNLLRLPLMFLPVSLSAIADAANAVSRLQDVFTAELLEDSHIVNTEQEAAIEIVDANFTWDGLPPDETEKKGKGKKGKAPTKSSTASGAATPAAEQEVFKLRDVNMSIPRGKLVAVVGSVGSGKSSLLQGIIGEMRLTSGSVTFGGTVAYCSQQAWVQNATIRENILFGKPFDETRYWQAIRDSCLESDLSILPHGDLTEVGEKGISLSGGQKQRLGICRAIYADSEIQLFDDPLSALDAHVGKQVFQNVLQSALSGKTRVLVTHALHFLPHVDLIYTMVDGRIAERGTYAELTAREEGAFAKFIKEFGAKEEEEESEGEKAAEAAKEPAGAGKMQKKYEAGAKQNQAEERTTGSVSGAVYADYFRAGQGKVILPLLVLAVLFWQGASVMSNYWLVYWQERKFDLPQGGYIGIYAALGVGQAVGFFFVGSLFAFFTYFASIALHRRAVEKILHAPMSFFDTTPLGRIMNRFSKDVDTIDNMLGEALRMFLATFANIIGAVVLVSIVLPWFLIAMAVVSIIYWYAALFYRSSARELKRLDSILRGSLYAHFGESLTGLATLRAYAATDRFQEENRRRLDIENRAYMLTVTNQRWLGIRLDGLGILLTFIVAILAVAARYSISPSQTGVTLSYILLVQQAFGWMVRQSAEVENDMNGVERLLHYAKNIEQEAAYEIPEHKPPPSWPSEGRVEMTDVKMAYRSGLPLVLKGITMSSKPSEKIGVVGRTGAGKSSIMLCLFRIVELSGGSIKIDDIDISTLGLQDLRKHVAIIPQEPLLFSGTMRSNLDPFGEHDDQHLWDAMRRAHLVDEHPPAKVSSDDADDATAVGAQTPSNANRFTLDTPIDDEGANLSVGQRSLVSLARAIVKNSRVLVLDEATASVDYETDARIQETIATEFKNQTILCIAHRLRTILSYDRILVLSEGRIAEFDTPRNLFNQADGIFRGMCERSSISLDDIRLASKARHGDEDDA